MPQWSQKIPKTKQLFVEKNFICFFCLLLNSNQQPQFIFFQLQFFSFHNFHFYSYSWLHEHKKLQKDNTYSLIQTLSLFFSLLLNSNQQYEFPFLKLQFFYFDNFHFYSCPWLHEHKKLEKDNSYSLKQALSLFFSLFFNCNQQWQFPFLKLQFFSFR